MRSCEELTKEVLKKIEKKKAARAKLRARLQAVAAIVLVIGVFVPAAMYLVGGEDGNRFAPLAKPYEDSSPLQEENDSSSNAPEAYFGEYSGMQVPLVF